MPTRRQFLKYTGMAGAGVWLQTKVGWIRQALAQIPGGTLAPGEVAKYVLPLVKPPATPLSNGSNKSKDKYKIAVRQFNQRILSPPHPVTPVWSYGSTDFPGTVAEGGTFNYPAFKVLGRGANGSQPPEPCETGSKDTVIAYPGEIARIKATYDLPGFYVWHCHIVEHEDNEMMRPYHVGPISPDAPAG